MNQQIRDALCEMGYEEAVVFDGPDFDEAIVGVSEEGRVIYDFDKMVQVLVERDGMEEIEAVEFIEYNSIRALPYVENAPIVMSRIRLQDDPTESEHPNHHSKTCYNCAKCSEHYPTFTITCDKDDHVIKDAHTETCKDFILCEEEEHDPIPQ